MKIAFVTFVDGPKNFRDATKRIVNQAQRSGMFSAAIGLNNFELCDNSKEYLHFQKKSNSLITIPIFIGLRRHS
jgi:hypothetical protein